MRARIAWPIAALAAFAAVAVGLYAQLAEPAVPADPSTAPPSLSAAAPGWVDVRGGTRHLAAREDGLVASVAVEEGDRVEAGAVLLRLDDHQARNDVAQLEVELERRRAERRALLDRVGRARQELARVRPLVAQQAEPADELRQAEQHGAELAAQSEQARLAEQATTLQLQAARDKLDRLELRAPSRGQVLRVGARATEGVTHGQELVWFAPEAPLIVRAELDERLFSAVHAGMVADVVPEYDDAHAYTARVVRVARSVGPVQALPQVRAAARDDRVVECILELGPADLLIGQRVVVSIRDAS